MNFRNNVQKVEVFSLSGDEILTANTKSFSLPQFTDRKTGEQQNVLIVKGRGLPTLGTGSQVDIVMYQRTGQRVKYQGQVKLSTGLQLNIAFVADNGELMKERRRYYKVPTNLLCVINNVLRDDESLVPGQPMAARIQDFNIGGVFLCFSDAELLPGDEISLSMTLNGNLVDVSAEVLRIQLSSEGKVSGYGCRFVGVSPQIEEVFAQFVYQAQREEMKKNNKNK